MPCSLSSIFLSHGLSVDPLHHAILLVVINLKEEERPRVIAVAIVDVFELVVMNMQSIVRISNENVQIRRSSITS